MTEEAETNYRGRITIDFIDTPHSARPEAVVSTDGEVFPLDAVMAFGQLLDNSINRGRNSEESAFRDGGREGKRILSRYPLSSNTRGHAQAGLIRSVVDDIVRARIEEAGLRLSWKEHGDA
jgi:hypothetical protein